MARSTRFKGLRSNASKQHIEIFEMLKEIYPVHVVYHEYPLSDILKKGYQVQQLGRDMQDLFLYKRASRLKADLCIPDLSLVIECQGQHHYGAVDYGDGKGEENYQHRLHLDKIKRLIYKEAGFTLLEIPYFEKLTRDELEDKILKANQR